MLTLPCSKTSQKAALFAKLSGILRFALSFTARAYLSGHPGVLGCSGMALSPNWLVWREVECVAVYSTLSFDPDGVTLKDTSTRAHRKVNEKPLLETGADK